jgi:hypothetical protein
MLVYWTEHCKLITRVSFVHFMLVIFSHFFSSTSIRYRCFDVSVVDRTLHVDNTRKLCTLYVSNILTLLFKYLIRYRCFDVSVLDTTLQVDNTRQLFTLYVSNILTLLLVLRQIVSFYVNQELV